LNTNKLYKAPDTHKNKNNWQVLRAELRSGYHLVLNRNRWEMSQSGNQGKEGH